MNNTTHATHRTTPHHNAPQRRWAIACVIVGAVVSLSAGCASTSQVRAEPMSAEARARTLPDGRTCRADARVQREQVADDVVAFRCVRVERKAVGQRDVVHGPTLVIARRQCQDGRVHELRVGRDFVHGEQRGVEFGAADGVHTYTRTLRDHVPDTLATAASSAARCGNGPCAGWGSSVQRGRTCFGMHLCGVPVGYAECGGEDGIERGAMVDGALHGHGLRVNDQGELSAMFQRGQAHGRGHHVLDNGDVFRGHFESGVRHGEGRIDYAAGGWLTGSWRDGRMNGRVVTEDANGVRVVTRWSKGEVAKLIRRYTVKRRNLHTREVVTLTTAGKITSRRRSRVVAPWLAVAVERLQGEVRLHFWRVDTDTASATRPDSVPAEAEKASVSRLRGDSVAAKAEVIAGWRQRLHATPGGDVRILSWLDHGTTSASPVQVGQR